MAWPLFPLFRKFNKKVPHNAIIIFIQISEKSLEFHSVGHVHRFIRWLCYRYHDHRTIVNYKANHTCVAIITSNQERKVEQPKAFEQGNFGNRYNARGQHSKLNLSQLFSGLMALPEGLKKNLPYGKNLKYQNHQSITKVRLNFCF